MMGRISIVLFALSVITAYFLYQASLSDPIPVVEDEFWGPSSLKGKAQDESVRPFKINVEDKTISDLKSKLKQELASNRFTPPLEGTGFEYGFNSDFLQKIVSYWHDKYDWRKREVLINKYPHFKTRVGGLDIHFQHVKPNKNKKTLPLLVMHGWPGSFIEFQKIIPLLSEPSGSNVNYELIIPSLPGYGFSEGSHRPGLDTVAIANIFHRLMKRLGHDRYYVMGGDWGAMIASDMATLYPNNVQGLHSTMCVSQHPLSHLRLLLTALIPSLGEPEIMARTLPLSKTFSFIIREMGYAHIQATKPDTVGVSLSLSPTGLAAYILEKFSTWTDRSKIGEKDGGLLDKFKLDELLDNVMIYWVTNSITTSVRLYSEAMFIPGKKHNLDKVPITVPSACLNLPEELMLSTSFALRDKYLNLKQFTIAKSGGHFSAFEVPETVAQDAVKFFNGLQQTPKKK